MSEPQEPAFMVSAYTDPIVVKINGKANYLNCNAFREFLEKMLSKGSSHYLLDFTDCRGMDSTFLGILAGTALELRKASPPGTLVLTSLGERNYELIKNLGLHKLLSIAEEISESGDGNFDQLQNEEVSNARNVLEAHENLVEASGTNAAKFQDVIAFLRNQLESEESE